MLLLALIPAALAHRPGLSAARIEPARVVVVFAEEELAGRHDPEALFAAASVEVGAARCGIGPPTVRRVENDGVEVSAGLWCGPGTRTWRAGFLPSLSPDHRHTVEAVDAAGHVVSAGLLDRAHPTAELVGVGPGAVARQWIRLGAEHIATGWDHLAFVVGLALGSRRVRDMIVAATGFTAGHAITIALGATGLLVLPSWLVEATIAASIAVVAIENLVAPPPPRRRAALAAAFGLVHGLGFAGALREIGLPAGARLIGLLGFNVGIEAGQAVLLVGLGAVLAAAGAGRDRLVGGGSLLLAIVGTIAALARLLGGLTDG